MKQGNVAYLTYKTRYAQCNAKLLYKFNVLPPELLGTERCMLYLCAVLCI